MNFEAIWHLYNPWERANLALGALGALGAHGAHGAQGAQGAHGTHGDPWGPWGPWGPMGLCVNFEAIRFLEGNTLRC